AARALKPWLEVKDLAEQLCNKWPVRALGVQQISWPEERLTLTLHTGQIEDTLPRAHFKTDAWFLDGFSPAKNEAMWADSLWAELAERSNPKARVATFTVAGAVRRGLESAGFSVEKKPGHGRKRERLEAVYPGDGAWPEFPTRPQIAIIGAGISGACLANALTQRGAEVTVFDAASGPDQGTSANPLALIMPRLDAADTIQARLLVDAYLSAQSFYCDLEGASITETQHFPRDDTEARRFEKLLADPPLGLEQLEAIRNGGVLHKASMILQPAKIRAALLAGLDVRWGLKADIDLDTKRVNGSAYESIVLAGGWHLETLVPNLDLTARLGQVESFESEVDAPPGALASGHYALASGRTRLWGATFEDHCDGDPEATSAARDSNISALDALNPYWLRDAKSADLSSHVGVRATTADRLPLIGRLPDNTGLLADRPALERAGWKLPKGAHEREGLFVAGGYGSRGFTWAPWAARILTAEIFGDPSPASNDSLRTIAPIRQTLRRIKRGLI
ncbi:MAG: FAD-dependent 5-carboxymethylaminomethyl-2-thiouridine(34) oxidoreductase MnmC, partial [Pseudomonadota bacterium]